MNMKTIVAIAAILVVLGAGYALARPAGGSFWGNMMGGYGGSGMMGNGGMMGGYGGNSMMGNGGMMGGYGHCGADYENTSYGVNATPITIEDAKKSVEKHLASTGNSDLKLTEIIEFDNHFYAGVKENSTGVYAFELLVNKYTGAIIPEMGPNMMWNTKYGYMNWNMPAQTNITEKQAVEYAQNYLDKALPGTKVGDADDFYGYYTIEVLKDGKIYGMLSVNSNTGAVWYHNWHGNFIKILEAE